MVISQSPFRISFFGGGTDYPAWYREHGGATLVTTIDKYCTISCRELPPFFDYRHRIVYSNVETVREVDEIRHPSVRAVLRHFGTEHGLEIHHDGDLPARAGLGSSSAFTVGILHAMHAMRGRMISKHDLAREALHIEQQVIGEAVGSQDQVASTFGGFNRIDFRQNDSFSLTPVAIDRERLRGLRSHLMLAFTGFQRHAPAVAQKLIANLDSRRRELIAICDMVEEGYSIVTSPASRLEDFGRLLHESWKVKRSLADGITNPQLDEIYRAALSAGAIGGKILGAGGGGFFLFFAPPEAQPRVRERLAKLVHVDFEFESHGSRIVLNDPDVSTIR